MNITSEMRRQLERVRYSKNRTELYFDHASASGAINMAFGLGALTLDQYGCCQELLASAFKRRAMELTQ